MTYYLQVTISFENLQITLGSKDIIEASYSTNSMDSTLSLNPGICEQSAMIKFYDTDGKVEDLFESGNNTTSSISFNVYDSNGKIVETRYFTSSQYSFDRDIGSCTIECTDSLDFLNNIDLPRMPTQSDSFTLFELIANTMARLPSNKSFKYQDTDARDFCLNLHLPKAWYDAQSMYDLIVKICNIGMLRIYSISNVFYIGRCFHE